MSNSRVFLDKKLFFAPVCGNPLEIFLVLFDKLRLEREKIVEIILGHKGKVVLLVGVFRCLGDTRIVGIEEDVAACRLR